MIIQLNPPLPLNTPKGSALAHFLVDYGPEHNIMWVCFTDSEGQCWTWQNSDIRACTNITMHRTNPEVPEPLSNHSSRHLTGPFVAD